MNGFIKMDNDIFRLGLSPKAFFLYTYLLSRCNCFGSTAVSYAALAGGCRMDPKTIRSALRELTANQLVRKQNRYGEKGYRSNRYFVAASGSKHGWFKVNRAVFETAIRPTDFMVFCFICKCLDGKRGEAFPSLSAIASATGIGRSRVARAIAYLKSYTFLNRVHRRYRRTRAFRHNRYLPFRISGKKRKARAEARTKLISISRITRTIQNVKRFCRFLITPFRRRK